MGEGICKQVIFKKYFHASPGSMHDTGCSGLVHWDDPERWYGEGGSGWGTHVCLWQIHFNIWQNQYDIVKFKNKIKLKKK